MVPRALTAPGSPGTLHSSLRSPALPDTCLAHSLTNRRPFSVSPCWSCFPAKNGPRHSPPRPSLLHGGLHLTVPTATDPALSPLVGGQGLLSAVPLGPDQCLAPVGRRRTRWRRLALSALAPPWRGPAQLSQRAHGCLERAAPLTEQAWVTLSPGQHRCTTSGLESREHRTGSHRLHSQCPTRGGSGA